MSGHSKWSKVKHQKAVTDSAKGKVFTKMASAIIIAVKEGGGSDPSSNFKLRLAIEKARSFNMPKENIERAIERALKSGSEGNLYTVTYEAMGPNGVGFIIEAATDNKQRTVSEVKNILERGGGVLTTPGSVSHLFTQLGQITVEGGNSDKIMEVALETGALDMEESEGQIHIFTNPKDVHRVKDSLEKHGFGINAAELIFHPVTTIPITTKVQADKIHALFTALSDADDVAKVFVNCDIPDEFL